MSTYEKILKIIKENELVDSEVEITPEKNLIFDLQFDSVKLMGLLFEIEQEFDISIIIFLFFHIFSPNILYLFNIYL